MQLPTGVQHAFWPTKDHCVYFPSGGVGMSLCQDRLLANYRVEIIENLAVGVIDGTVTLIDYDQIEEMR